MYMFSRSVEISSVFFRLSSGSSSWKNRKLLLLVWRLWAELAEWSHALNSSGACEKQTNQSFKVSAVSGRVYTVLETLLPVCGMVEVIMDVGVELTVGRCGARRLTLLGIIHHLKVNVRTLKINLSIGFRQPACFRQTNAPTFSYRHVWTFDKTQEEQKPFIFVQSNTLGLWNPFSIKRFVSISYRCQAGRLALAALKWTPL